MKPAAPVVQRLGKLVQGAGAPLGERLSALFENGRTAKVDAPDEDPGVPTRDPGASQVHAQPNALQRAYAFAEARLSGLRRAMPALSASSKKVFFADPDPVKAKAAEAAAYDKLRANLEKMGLPAYATRVVEGAVSEDRPTVAILAPASTHKLAMAQEGGRQAPGDVNLVLDPSWLIQEARPGGNKLWMKRGLSFTAGGQAIVTEYEVPRRVRYFANYYTLGANDRADGVPLEENLDVPQSSSLRLEPVTNDKVGTRPLLAAAGVLVPATLALLLPQNPLAGRHRAQAPGVVLETLASPDARREQIARSVNDYLDHFPASELVVKPSGPQFHSGRGVKFFKKSDRAAIIEHALSLSEDPMMTQDGAVLIDERVPSLPILRDRKLETTLRVLVARTPDGGGAVTGVFARVGPWGKPTSAEAADPKDNATAESWEALLAEWVRNGQISRRQAAELDEKVRAMGPAALKALSDHERTVARKPGDPKQDQTDLIGLDVMIAQRAPGADPEPVVIEVNDHDSGGQYHLEYLLHAKPGEHSAAWVATMLARARRDALRGKRIVLVGAGHPGNAGYPNKKIFFDTARELGVKVVLIDKPGSWAKDLVEEYIPVDTTKPETARAEALKKLLRSARKSGEIDGITTFWEDDVMLTSKLARDLGLRYHPEAAAETARNKFELREKMSEAGLPTPSFAMLKSRADLERQLERGFPFPAVLKPARGAAAMGVMKVGSADEARAAYEKIVKEINPELDAIFAQGSEVLMDEYLDGHEGDADIVWQGGRAVYESVTDNWPTREPYFLATGSSLPSRLLTKAQQREALDLAEKTLAALKFSDGVFHVEFKVTSKGPRLIEVNARPGGVYVVPWNLAVNGGKVERLEMAPGARTEGFHDLLTLKPAGSDVAAPPAGYDRVGMLTAYGKTAEEAQANLAKQRERLRLEIR
ncbi:MAG: ATP-grasp domain-containing protein [Elusimicrobia bacterium]|nr:ATP-grasp domain-containing protein [Elusimicrobiota bacterium]